VKRALTEYSGSAGSLGQQRKPPRKARRLEPVSLLQLGSSDMPSTARRRRVLAISSGGGHWIQLQRLRPAFEEFDVAYASVFPDYADDVPGARYYQVTDATRRNAVKLVVLVPQLIGILLRERPDVVITTGALPGLAALAVAKYLIGARTVWIDSIANCERLSSSGKQARFVADEWLTQWGQLATESGPRYWGSVL